ncbi:MAG: protoporphyrinogen oxidase [Pirellulales bacterium]
MGRLVAALVGALPNGVVRLNAPVTKLERHASTWHVTTDGAAPEAYDAVIVALHAPQAARIVKSVDGTLSDDLGRIEYAGATIVVGCYKLAQIRDPLDAFGFVVPEVERRDILAASFSSRKFPGRAPEGSVIIRTFLGGAMRPDLVEASDAEVRRTVARELSEILGVAGEPLEETVVRWHGAMPQYHLGHVELVDRIEARAKQHSGLALAGNAYRGVGVPQCITSGQAAAAQVLGRG